MNTLFPRNTIDYFVVTITTVDGEDTETPVAGTFVGSVQPTTGKDIETLPSGFEDRGSVKIYSDTELNVSKEGSNTPGDIVVWQGQKWRITFEQKFQNLIKHYKYIAHFEEEV